MSNKSINNNEKLCVKYKGINIEANLVYRNRKSISIQIKPVDNITIISPKTVTKKKLKEILIEKGDWIIEKLDKYKNLEEYYKEREYISGEKLFYLGKEHILQVIKDKPLKSTEDVSVEIRGNKIIIKSSEIDKEYIKNVLKKWYKKESEKLVIERLINCRENSQLMMKLVPSSVKVKEQKKRWGSCTSRKDIYINSRISMLKPEVIDYILVHEFSHLVHMNHSKDFYNLVENILPNYKEQETWLKENSHKLNL